MSSFWPFSGWAIPQSLQKRLLKFLLKRAIGQFLAAEINLDQLDVQLGNGQVVLKDLELNLDILNNLCADLPFIVTDGHVARINVSIPWKDLGNSDCTLELDGLNIELTPLMDDPAAGLSRSSHLSESQIMSSSIHFAENFLRSEITADDDFGPEAESFHQSARPSSSPTSAAPSAGLDGLQVLARLIDKILARAKVTAKNTTIRLVHRSNHSIVTGSPSELDQQYHIDLSFPFLKYEDQSPIGHSDLDQSLENADRLKYIKFAGITISLKQVTTEGALPRKPAVPSAAVNSTTYSYESIIASTSNKQEDVIRMLIRGTMADLEALPNAPGPPHNLGLDIQVSVDSLCSLVLPEQMVVLVEAFRSLGEGQAFLARNRQYADLGEEYRFGRHDVTPSSPAVDARRLSWPDHGYPAAGEYVTPADSQDSRHLRLQIAVKQLSVYLVTETGHAIVDAPQFYTLFFGGQSAAHHENSIPENLSTSFITKLNTRLNTGSATMQEVLGEALSAQHIKTSVSDILVVVGHDEVGGIRSARDSSELSVKNAHISEWRPTKSSGPHASGASSGLYHPILVFESQLKVDAVTELYAQLSSHESPKFGTHRPLDARNTDGRPLSDAAQSQVPAIVVSLKHHLTGSDGSLDESGSEHVTVKLAPMVLYLSLPFLERLRQVLPKGLGEPIALHENGSSELNGSAPSVGAIMDDLSDSTDQDDPSNRRILSIELSLLRIWFAVSHDQQGLLGTPKSNSIWVDLVDAQITTQTEACHHATGRRGSIGSGNLPFDGGCSANGSNANRRWIIDCHTLGLSTVNCLERSAVQLRPFMSITKGEPEPARNRNETPMRPILDITIRSHICDVILQRPSIEVHHSPTGLRFDREPEEEQSSTYGMQSWYDLGLPAGSGKARQGNANSAEENDLLWFKQRTIDDSLVQVDCHMPVSYINLTKADYDELQLILNEFALRSAENSGFQDPVLSLDSPSDSSLLKFGLPSTELPATSAHTGDLLASREHEESAARFEVPPRKPCNVSVVGTCDRVVATIHSATSSESDATEQPERGTYSCEANGLRLFVVSGHEGKPTLYVWVEAQDAELSRVTGLKTPDVRCIHRTLLTSPQAKQMLAASFSITYDEELDMKETWASVTFSAFALEASMAHGAVQDIVTFLKEPPEVALVDMTSRFTKLHINLNDACVNVQPQNMPAVAVLLIDSFRISCNLIPDSPTVSLKLLMYNASVYVIGDRANRKPCMEPEPDGYLNSKKHFAAEGFANVITCDFMDLSVRTNSGSITPSFELEVSNNHLSLDTCADSFQTLVSIVQYLIDGGDHPHPAPEAPASKVSTQPVDITLEGDHGDVLGSLDDHAFGPPPGTFTGAPVTSCDLQMEPLDGIFSAGDESLSPGGSEDYDFGMGDSPSERLSPSSRLRADIAPPREDVIRVLTNPADFRIIDRFFPVTSEAGASGMPTKDSSLFRIRLQDLDLSWNVYDGYDWESTRQQVLQGEQNRKQKRPDPDGHSGRHSRRASMEASSPPGRSTHSTFISPFANETSSDAPPELDEHAAFDSIASYLLPTLQQQQTSPQQQHTGRGEWREHLRDDATSVYSGTSAYSGTTTHTVTPRSQHHHRRRPTSTADLVRSQSAQVLFKVYALNVEFDTYPEDAQTAWQLAANIRDVEIIDNVASSRWRKFLSYMRPDANAPPREPGSKMIRVDLSNVRPDPARSPDEELRLKIDILPLRLHVDQDALACLLRFFTYEHPRTDVQPSPPANDTTFFQLCDIQPLSVKIDYKPKHVDYANLKGGNLVEMLNFFPLEAAEMNLRGVRLTGVRGWSRIMEGVLGQWLPHIRSTQIPNMASGVTGVRSLVNIGSGLADLVLLPLEQYKKDGRIIRGLQKGAKSFAKAATSETIKIGTKLAVGTQGLLEQADEIFGGEGSGGGGASESGPGSPRSFAHHQGGADHVSKYAEQPSDVKEGVELAYRSLSRNVATAARTVLAVPMEVYENTGTQGTVRAVMRAVPVAVLRPMIGATEAVSKTLMGLQNSMDPSRRVQMEDK
ncbi:autophagy- protein 2 [Thoreauomyces humboldtii]|nr:autophagy- protein 2 [Thoreauomyces humboldtii]